jgi:serine protease Do
LLVQEVFDDTPAAAAGLRRGDLIVTMNDTAVDSVDVLYEALSGQGPQLRLGVVRGADEIEITVAFE